jgi:hypothetical protein
MPSATAENKIVASTDRKPSARQIYAVAHMTVEALGLEWPGSRAEASELISRLRDLKSEGGGDDCPF